MECCVLQTVVTDVEYLNIVHFDAAGPCVIPSNGLDEQQAEISSPSWVPAAPAVWTGHPDFHRSVQTPQRRRLFEPIAAKHICRKSFISVAHPAKCCALHPMQQQADELLAEDKRSRLQMRRWEESNH